MNKKRSPNFEENTQNYTLITKKILRFFDNFRYWFNYVELVLSQYNLWVSSNIIFCYSKI